MEVLAFHSSVSTQFLLVTSDELNGLSSCLKKNIDRNFFSITNLLSSDAFLQECIHGILYRFLAQIKEGVFTVFFKAKLKLR
jgi:hypothetical protein